MQEVIKFFIHVTFEKVEKILRINLLLLGKKSTRKQLMNFFKRKPPTILSHFSISYQTYTTKIAIFLQIDVGLSQQKHYPESTIFEDTRTISRDNPLAHRKPISHTTKTTRDHEDDGIMETI